MIGTYEYVADDEGGVTSSMGVRGIYRCTDCSYDLQLYYNPPGGAFSVSIFHNLAVNEVCSSCYGVLSDFSVGTSASAPRLQSTAPLTWVTHFARRT